MSVTWTIDGVKEALVAKKISARELIGDFYKRIESRNAELNAFLALAPERAYRQADKIDALVAARKPLPPLGGVPIAVKDVISTQGITTTCGSKILENYVPPYDATAVARLEAAGAILLGKTNCDEFAMGSSNENSAYGAVKNPAAEPPTTTTPPLLLSGWFSCTRPAHPTNPEHAAAVPGFFQQNIFAAHPRASYSCRLV